MCPVSTDHAWLRGGSSMARTRGWWIKSTDAESTQCFFEVGKIGGRQSLCVDRGHRKTLCTHYGSKVTKAVCVARQQAKRTNSDCNVVLFELTKSAGPKTGPCHRGNVRIGIAQDRQPHVSQSYDVLRRCNPHLLLHCMTDIWVDCCRVGIRSLFHHVGHAEHVLVFMINPSRHPNQSKGLRRCTSVT